MAEIIPFPQSYRIAYTDGEDESFVSDGYGHEWVSRDRGEADDYASSLRLKWPGFIFWVV